MFGVAAPLTLLVTNEFETKEPAQAAQTSNTKYIRAATVIADHLGTYKPENAQSRFSAIRKYLREPLLSTFDEQMMQTELEAIHDSGRSQTFIFRQDSIHVEHFPEQNALVVGVTGRQHRSVYGRALPYTRRKTLPLRRITYYVKFQIPPKSKAPHEEIAVIDIRLHVHK